MMHRAALNIFALIGGLALLAVVALGGAVMSGMGSSWLVGGFVGLESLAAILFTFLFMKGEWNHPRFKWSILLNWTAVAIFILGFLWFHYVA